MEGPPAVPLGPSHSPVLTKRGPVCPAPPPPGPLRAHVIREGAHALHAAPPVAAVGPGPPPPTAGPRRRRLARSAALPRRVMHGLAGSGRAPLRASRDHFVRLGYEKMPTSGPLSPAVPGEVHAWGAILERFGTRELGKLIAPAAELADDGFPLPAVIGSDFARLVGNGKVLRDYPSSAKTFLRPAGRPHKAGEVRVQTDHARSRRRRAVSRVDASTTGPLATDIAARFPAGAGLRARQCLRYRCPGSRPQR